MTGDDAPSPFDDPASGVRKDVLRNLYNVLNARRGRMAGCPDYGLDDVEDLGRSPTQVAEAIRRLIQRFEPRIDRDSLRVAPSDDLSAIDPVDRYFRASFIVHGQMILPRGETRAINIRTTVLAEAAQVDGQVEDLDTAMGPVTPRRILVEGAGDEQ